MDIELDKLSSFEHGSQTAEWSYRGFKKFYFNPGLYDDNSDNDILMTTSINPSDI